MPDVCIAAVLRMRNEEWEEARILGPGRAQEPFKQRHRSVMR